MHVFSLELPIVINVQNVDKVLYIDIFWRKSFLPHFKPSMLHSKFYGRRFWWPREMFLSFILFKWDILETFKICSFHSKSSIKVSRTHLFEKKKRNDANPWPLRTLQVTLYNDDDFNFEKGAWKDEFLHLGLEDLKFVKLCSPRQNHSKKATLIVLKSINFI